MSPQRQSSRKLVARVALIYLVLIVGVLLYGLNAKAAEPTKPAPKVQVPEVSALYRIQIERASARYFGLDAQPARMAAQIHQESAWRPLARSPYANGLAQFTPATAKWLPKICPELGPPDPWDTTWSLGAQSCYMSFLWNRTPKFTGGSMSLCDMWAFALRSYNGGEGWVEKERVAAYTAGVNANDWHQVERFRRRAAWAHKENIEYPQRILLRIEPAYLAAGWPGGPPCR